MMAKKKTSICSELPILLTDQPALTICLEPRPTSIDPALLSLDRSETVECSSELARLSSLSRGTVGHLVDHIRDTIDRQSKGFYTLNEVAQILADEHRLNAVRLLEQMVAAFHHGKLTVRDTATKAPLLRGATLRTFYDWVRPEDIDELLVAWRTDYRFPQPAHREGAADTGATDASSAARSVTSRGAIFDRRCKRLEEFLDCKGVAPSQRRPLHGWSKAEIFSALQEYDDFKIKEGTFDNFWKRQSVCKLPDRNGRAAPKGDS